MTIEICVNSALSAVEAMAGGANRVELCENLYHGGTTPSQGTMIKARELVDIDLFVMIRPRGGDFLYSDHEFDIMKEDIVRARESGVDGVVTGILLPDGSVDVKRMATLIELARPLEVTFHRAFDMTADPFKSMEDIIALGTDRILTSGQRPSALEGAPLIRELIRIARGRIAIMPGSGIKEHNVINVVKQTGAEEIHIRLDKQEPSRMIFQQSSVFMGNTGQTEFEIPVTDRIKVAEVVRLLNN
jgi:copper homeostasis protein